MFSEQHGFGEQFFQRNAELSSRQSAGAIVRVAVRLRRDSASRFVFRDR